MALWGFKTALPPGTRAALALCRGFAELTASERAALAGLIARILPALADEAGGASALPVAKIGAILKDAVGEAWTGIMQPRKLGADFAATLEVAPEAALLRAECRAISAAVEAQSPAVTP